MGSSGSVPGEVPPGLFRRLRKISKGQGTASLPEIPGGASRLTRIFDGCYTLTSGGTTAIPFTPCDPTSERTVRGAVPTIPPDAGFLWNPRRKEKR